MPKKIIVPDEMVNIMIAEYSTGDNSCRDIGKKHGYDYRVVSRVLRDNNIPISNTKSIISKKASGRPSARRGKRFPEAGKKQSDFLKKIKEVDHDEYLRRCSIRSKARIKWMQENPEAHQAILKKAKSAVKAKSFENRDSTRKSRLIREQMKRLVSSVLRHTECTKDGLSSSKILGYTGLQLITYIEERFTDGMTWDDRSTFHIDHIVPISAFISHGIYEPRIISALCNLQPLTPKENQHKSDKYDDTNFDKDLSNILSQINQ